jgi:hypothetical protein
MAIAPNGTVFFADEVNNRVRSISPSGKIRTIAGNGRGGWVRNGTPAVHATTLSPAAVTLDPRGRLTIADAGWSEVLRLEHNGMLTRLAGSRRYAGVYGVGS